MGRPRPPCDSRGGSYGPRSHRERASSNTCLETRNLSGGGHCREAHVFRDAFPQPGAVIGEAVHQQAALAERDVQIAN